MQNQHFAIFQDEVYLNQNLSITNEEIISAGCSSCHMEYAMDGKSLINTLIENYDSKLLVHKEYHPKHLKGLEDFLASHNEEEAAAKHVDYQELSAYLNED